jgi:hypothetical protein
MMSEHQHTWVYAMQIVEIRSEAEPLDSPFNILLDVGSRIGDFTVSKAVEATFRGN